MRVSDAAFGLTLMVILGAYFLMIVGQLRLPLEYDEAFNLTVVENFGERFFYGTNGALAPVVGTPVLFDPYITTGPTLLVPAAIVWRLFDGAIWLSRLVPVGFFALYLVGAWSMTSGLVGRWGRLIILVGPFALVMPVAFEHAAFVPTRFVGETAVVAMITWGLLLALRGKYWWGGVLIGLSVQTKYVAVIPATIVVLAVLVILVTRRQQDALLRSFVWVSGAVLPTISFEIVRLLTLGWGGYGENIKATFNYSRSVAQLGDKGGYDTMSKLMSLGNMFYTHSFLIVAGMFFITLALASFAVVTPKAPTVSTLDYDERWTMPIAVSATVLAGGSSLLFWILVVQERSGRHGLIGLLLLFPGLGLFLAYVVESVESRRFARLSVATVIFLASGFLVLDSALKSITAIGTESVLDEQVRVARLLEKSGTPSLDVDGWWQRPEFQILTDIPVETTGGLASVLVFDSIQIGYLTGDSDMMRFRGTELYGDKCQYSIYQSSYYVLCRPSR